MSKKKQDVLSYDENPPHPPEAPDVERQFKQYVYQWIGIPLIMLIPVLSMLGVFGETMASTAAEEAGILALDADYISRFRYKTHG